MPKEISFVCDCGYRCEFSEGTVREVKAASLKWRQALIPDEVSTRSYPTMGR